MLPPSRRFRRFRGWILGVTLVGVVTGCRFGYEILDEGDSAGVGGTLGDGDGDGDLAAVGGTNGDGDLGAGGGAGSGGATGVGGGIAATGGMGGAPAVGGAGSGGDSGSGGSTFDCGAESFFCSGFEVPLLDEWTEVLTSHASCLVQGSTSQVFAESSALSTFAPGNRTTARISYEFPTPIGVGPLSARVWFYLPSSVTLNGSVVILELHDPMFGATGKASINLGVNDTVILEATTGISPAVSTSANNAFSRDAWNCAVLRADVGDPGSLEVELNGATLHNISGGDVHPSPGFARVMVGLYKLGSTDVQLYFDEVSVAQAALTCP